MAHITLSIQGLLDQQMLLRPGGLYWLTVDQPSDAKRLAQQFFQALPDKPSATLVCAASSAQNLLANLDPHSGPAKIYLFEIPERDIHHALFTLTTELGRTGVKADSQVVLMLPATTLEALDSKRLKRWSERLRPWLRARQVTLLVLCHGEIQRLHEQLLELNEHLSGLARLYRYNGEIRYQLHFWFNDQSVCSGQEFKLAVENGRFNLIPQTLVDQQPRVADDQHIFLAERVVLEGSPSLSSQWYLFESRETLWVEAMEAQAATVVVSIDNSHQLLDLAQELHALREKCGTALKIIVREMEPAVRYRDERLLLACGANLIVPHGTLLSRFLSLVDSVQGQQWQYSLDTSFETLLDRQRPPQVRGLLSPQDFIKTIEHIYQSSSGEVTHQLMRLRPFEGLSEELFLNQMCLRRFGDIACLLDGWLYLFLFACRADGLEPALGNICRLPWRDMFAERQSLQGIADLPEESFAHAPALSRSLSIPVDHVVTERASTGKYHPLTPQRITLPLHEHQP